MKDLRKIILKELYKSTYNSAAAESVEQGDDELALDFLHHSNEMGIPELNGVYPPDVDNDGDTDADDAKHCTYSDHCDYDMDGFIDDTGKPVRNYGFYGVGSSDVDADGIPDDEDDELSVDRFDIRQRIQSELNTKEIEVGDYGDGKIECDNCDWSWDVKDGGDDLYMCHKCGYDNK